MTADQIRALPTPQLQSVVSGIAHAQGAKWADYTARLIASGELMRRARKAK